MNAPNLLSVSRMVLAIPVALAIVGGRPLLALGLGTLALVTDLLDGWLARRQGGGTELGKILDPLGDKVFVAALAGALMVEGRVPRQLVAVVIGRDLMLLVFGLWKLRTGRPVPPAEIPGKVAFFVLGAYLVGVLLGVAWPGWVPVVVGALYLLGAVKYLRHLPGLTVGRVAKGD